MNMQFIFRALSFLSLTAITSTLYIALYSLAHKSDKIGWDALADFIGTWMICIIIGLITAILITRKLQNKALIWTAVIGSIITLIMILGVRHKMNSKIEAQTQPIKLPKASPPAQEISFNARPEIPYFIAQLNFRDGVSYFYNAGQGSPTIQDSLVFKSGDITYAPPHFFPHYYKPDYQIVQLIGKTKSRHYVEVELNKKTKRTTWMDKGDLTLLTMDDLILHSSSIDLPFINDYPLRIKPMNHASPISLDQKYYTFRPIAVKNEFVLISIEDEGKFIREGWVRWIQDGRVLVIPNPLS